MKNKTKIKEFKAKHNDREIYRETYKGVTYIRCKYIGKFRKLGVDYFSYNEELYKILRSVHVGMVSSYTNSLIPSRGRFRFYDHKEKKQATIYASHLAYGCYCGLIKYETLAEDARKFTDYIKENNVVIDHLDDNYHNNTEYNLSLMPSADNNRKKDIVSKIKEPAACIVAHVNGEYRVRLFLHTNISYFMQEYDASPERRAAILAKTVPGGRPNLGWFEEHYICRSTNELLACLRREVRKYRKHTIPLMERRRGVELWAKTPFDECWSDDIHYALEEQSKLASADWSDAKPVLALRRADRDPKYFEYLKGRVKGLKLFPPGKYRIARKEVIA